MIIILRSILLSADFFHDKIDNVLCIIGGLYVIFGNFLNLWQDTLLYKQM